MDSSNSQDQAQFIPAATTIPQDVHSSSRALRRSLLRPISFSIDAVNALTTPDQDRAAEAGDTTKTPEQGRNLPYYALAAMLRTSSRGARLSLLNPITNVFHSYSSDNDDLSFHMDPAHDPLGAWQPASAAERPMFMPNTARPRTPSLAKSFRTRMKERLSEFFTWPVGSVTELIPPIYYVPPGWKEPRYRRWAKKVKKVVKRAGRSAKRGFKGVVGKKQTKE